MRWITALLIVLLLAAGAGWYYMATSSKPAKTIADRSSGGVMVKAAGRTYKDMGRVLEDCEPDPTTRSTPSLATAAGPSNDDFGAAPERRYEPNELLILDPGRDFPMKAGSLGFGVTEIIPLTALDMEIHRVRIPAGRTMAEARLILSREFPNLVIDANHRFQAQGSGTGALKNHARAVIGWENLASDCGQGVRLGMVDSTLDLSHPALKGRKIEFRSFHKQGRKPGPADHGTAIAAMLVGPPEWGGLLPGASLQAANMFDVDESGEVVGNAVGLLKAMDWMAETKVHAINLSVAGTDNKVLRKVFDRALSKGLTMVAAAGNWGRSDKPAYPAAYDGVIAVTALKGRELIYDHANQGSYIDFAAPGVQLWTAAPGGGSTIQSGTSFATPFIVVQLALRVAEAEAVSSQALVQELKTNAKDLGRPGKDIVFGWGRVDAAPKCR